MEFFIFIQILIEHSVSTRWRLIRRTASGLGLHYWPMSHKKDVRLVLVKLFLFVIRAVEPQRLCYSLIGKSYVYMYQNLIQEQFQFSSYSL